MLKAHLRLLFDFYIGPINYLLPVRMYKMMNTFITEWWDYNPDYQV